MIFDTLFDDVSLLGGPALLKLTKACPLVYFPHEAKQVLPKSLSVERIMDLGEHFRLPCSAIAIEDKDNCVIIARASEDPGLFQQYRFLTMHMSGFQAIASGVTTWHRVSALALGTVRILLASEHHYTVDTQLIRLIMGEDGEYVNGHDTMSDTDYCAAAQLIGQDAVTAIEELIYIESMPGFEGWPEEWVPAHNTHGNNTKYIIEPSGKVSLEI